VYGGYENIYFAPPSTPQTTYTDIAGLLSLTPNITNTAYTANQKVLQVFWTGAKYAITDKLDVTGAYYHYLQDNYGGPASCATAGSSSSHCAGTLDAVSAVVDWRFAPKFDVYAGAMFSEVNNGLANGYLFHTSIDPMAGLRFQF
jgi:predicted porin